MWEDTQHFSVSSFCIHAAASAIHFFEGKQLLLHFILCFCVYPLLSCKASFDFLVLHKYPVALFTFCAVFSVRIDFAKLCLDFSSSVNQEFILSV